MDKQQQVLSLIQGIAKKNLNPDFDESLFDSGLLDSFALTDLVASLEEHFKIKIPDSDLTPRKFDSVNRIVEYIESHQ
ncbi:MAG: acyl carrier protein [Bryobacteraceae bacterium]|nr:acyl carrier protein [Bryobacteraceae bacterium]